MEDKNFTIFIDYGSYNIKVGSIDNETGKVENQFEIPALRNASLAEYNNDKIIEKLVYEIEKKNKSYLDKINLMFDDLSLLTVEITNYKISDTLEVNEELLMEIVDDAKFQISENYPNYEIIHVITKSYIKDEEVIYESSINNKAKKFGINLIFFLYPNNILKTIQKSFAKHNVAIKKYIFSSYSKSLFYLNDVKDQEKVIFVDIGYKKTCSLFFVNKRLENIKILPIGGNHITKDISKILKINMENAERLKLNLNNLNSLNDFSNEDVELIKKIIFSRTEELLEKSTMLNNSYDNKSNIKLVFFGNGSKVLDNKFKSKIVFDKKIDFLDENYSEIFLSGLNLVKEEKETNNQNRKKNFTKKGFFEKFFNLFS